MYPLVITISDSDGNEIEERVIDSEDALNELNSDIRAMWKTYEDIDEEGA